MLPDRVSNPGPLTYESGALPIALRGPAAEDGREGHPRCAMASQPRGGHDFSTLWVSLKMCRAASEDPAPSPMVVCVVF